MGIKTFVDQILDAYESCLKIMNNKYGVMLLLLLLIVGLNACSQHSSEGKMAVTAVLLSPILIPAAIVKDSGKGIYYGVDHIKNTLNANDAIRRNDIRGLMQILAVYQTDYSTKKVEEAAVKMIELYQAQQLDLTRMDQVLFLSRAYLMSSVSINDEQKISVNHENLQMAWDLIQKYSEQREQYDLELKSLQESKQTQKADCLCNRYDIVGDSDILMSIRKNLMIESLLILPVEQQKNILAQCEKKIIEQKLLYLDYGQIGKENICSRLQSELWWLMR